MKTVFIVHSHPENQSFCSSLKRKAIDVFTEKGYTVLESDLYRMNFNPVGDRHDFTSLGNPDYFKYQAEQVYAFEHHAYAEDLQLEMQKLLQADIVIFNFPLWWFGLPAILKGWVDRIFAMGFAYGNGKGVYENGIFADKTAFLTFTTGGPEVAYNKGGKNGDLNTILFPIHHGMFYFTGMTVLPPFISFSPVRKSHEELQGELSRYSDYLNRLEEHTPLYTNR